MTNVKAAMKWAVTVLMAAALAAGGATPSSNIPIGQMPTATAVQGGAYLPIIQPRPGQTTNDNYKAQVDTLFTGRNAISVTNLYVTNLYVENIFSSDLIWTNAGPWIAPFEFTNAYRILPGGGVFAGQGLSGDAWFYTDDSVGFASLHDTDKGDNEYNRLMFGAEDHTSNPTNTAYLLVTTHTGTQPELNALFNATVGQAQSSYFQINLRPDAGNANLRLLNQDVLTFAVNDASGYSGTGTNFLSDDGTYKPGTGTRINPTDNFLPYRLDGATYDDSPMYRVDAQTVGVDTIDANVISATNLQSGGVVYSRADGILTNVPSGTGLLYNDGSNTNLTWISTNGFGGGQWTNRAGVLQPIDLTLPVGWTNQLILGPGTTNVLLREGRNLVYTNSDTSSVGPALVLRDGLGDEASLIVSGLAAVVKGSNATDLAVGTNSVRWTANLFSPVGTTAKLGNLGGNYYPWTDINQTGTHYVYGFENLTTGGTDYARLAISHAGTNGSPILLSSESVGTAGTNAGPFVLRKATGVTTGATNTLLNLQVGTTNRYVFAADYPVTGGAGLSIWNTNAGSSVTYGANNSGSAYVISGAPGGVVYLVPNNSSGGSFLFAQGGMFTDTDNVKDIGSSASNGAFKDIWQKGTHYVQGFNDGVGNYSRLAVSHAGTNGPITLASQAAGTAGSARPMALTTSALSIGGLPWELSKNPATYNQSFSYYVTNIFLTNLTSGDNLIFTSPTGMRTIGLKEALFTTNAVTYKATFRISGTDYQTGSSGSSSTTTSTTILDSLIREPGEGFAVNLNGNANVLAVFLVFTNTIPWYTARLLDVNAGNNVLYTCPTNTIVQGVVSHNNTLGPNPRVCNASGGARAYSWYLLPPNESTSNVFPFGVSASTANLAAFAPPGIQDYSMREGESVVVSSDASTDTQTAWMTVFESPE